MTHSKHRNRLITLLKELFQLDKPELDFGLYKIMHARADRVSQFLEHDLLAEIEAAFGEVDGNRIAEAKAAYETKLQQAQDLGAPEPEQAPAVKEARAAWDAAKDGGNSETDIYDHLYRFFERYYDKGDFMSRRYYARESDSRAAPYAVPYDGREVYLHWANKDQYYIKSSDYLTNYSFDLNEAIRQEANDGNKAAAEQVDAFADSNDGAAIKVHFRIVDGAEGEHGNVKEANDKKRLFVPFAERPAETNADGELVLNFQYKALPGGQYDFDEAAIKQHYGSLNKADMPHYWMADVFLAAIDALPDLPAAYGQQLRALAPPKSDNTKQKKRPLLVKYLNKYTSRNTMDYFIHKDLGGFLRRELDFYIKNEIMQLDAIDQADAPQVESYLAKIKVLRRIAHQLIDFLAQLENFQKKLWLKKKFVTETHYGITLDRVPESLYEDIADNDAQREEWCELFHIEDIQGDLHTPAYSDPLSVDFLKANPFLVLDTKHFSADFKARLINEIDNFDEQCDGLLISGDNFQGMNLIRERHLKQVRLAYIDPPYNTGGDDFMYKDAYQHSSWLSFIQSRMYASLPLLAPTYNYLSSIDDEEAAKLRLLFEEVLSDESFVADIAYERSGSSGLGQGGSIVNTKEHILVCSANKAAMNDVQYEREIEVETLKRYNKILTNTGVRELQDSFVAPSTGEDVKIYRHENFQINTISLRSFLERRDEINLEYTDNFKNIFRLTSVQKENEFQNRILSLCNNGLYSADYLVSRGRFAGQNITLYYFNGQIFVWLRDSARLEGNTILKGNKITDHWSHGEIPKADLANEGGVTLSRGKKPEQLMKRLIEWCSNEREFVLDYFAGSGSTAAAAMKLRRKFIAIDAEKYFDDKSVLRIKNVLCGEKSGISKQTEWKGGGLCKYIRLESYEDALNNLTLRDNANRDKALENNDKLRRDYLLNYFLDVETKESQSLLNVDAFRDPTAYTMQIKQPGSDEAKAQSIDLVETFNWLIGLWVEHLAAPQTFAGRFEREKDPQLPEADNTRLLCKRLKPDADGDYWFRLVEGYTLKVPGDKTSQSPTLVIWRKLTDDAERDNAALQKYLRVIGVSTREHVYDTIYVNGSHTLPNPVVDGEKTKVRLLEDAFHTAMWEQT